MSDFPQGIRDVVVPLWRELSSSFSQGLGISNRREDPHDPDARVGATTNSGTPHPHTPVPKTSVLHKNPQIVAGVLLKYINLASGWRPRLFVLHNGIFQYYKIYGPTAVDVHTLLDSLRHQGDLFLIGTEISVVESQYAAPGANHILQPRAEIHMQVGSIRQSKADSRKFYVNSGTSTLTLRSETPDDRWIWVEALKAAKGAWTGMDPVGSNALKLQGEIERHLSFFDQRKDDISAKLADAKADEILRQDILSAIDACREQCRQLAVSELSKRRALMDVIYRIENEKRQLETALVVESSKGDVSMPSLMQPSITPVKVKDSDPTVGNVCVTPEERQSSARRQLAAAAIATGIATSLVKLSNGMLTAATAARDTHTTDHCDDDDAHSNAGGTSSRSDTLPGDDGERQDSLALPVDVFTRDDDEDDDDMEDDDNDLFYECDVLSLLSGGASLHSRSSSMNDMSYAFGEASPKSTGSVGGNGARALVEGTEVSPSIGQSAQEILPGIQKAQHGKEQHQQQQRHISTDHDEQHQHHASPLSSLSLPPPPPPPPAAATTTTTTTTSEPAVIRLDDAEWLQKEPPPPPRRISLPKPLQQEKSVSLWSLIKEMVGKDLTRVCLPVYFNEPLSALQKTAEDLEYSELLDEAALCPPCSIERLLRISAFAVSAYSSTVGRTAKPFNPLLGETYELIHKEKGFRFIAEKVGHHPTTIAAHAEGRGWTFEGDAEVKSRFWGRSIELKPEGALVLTFRDGDAYIWNKVTTSINNLVLGKIYIDHGGVMKVQCLSHAAAAAAGGGSGSGLVAKIRFKETGMLFDKDPRQVRGCIERDGVKLDKPILHGHWDDALYAELEDGRRVKLWSKAPPPPEPTRYNLTSFAIQLNELTPGLREKIAPTDCRLRPDQSFTEKGMWDEANKEKQRLEHKQRAARAAAERGEPLRPRWFAVPAYLEDGRIEGRQGTVQQKSNTGNGNAAIATDGVGIGQRYSYHQGFKYKGGYWESRENGEYVGCRDIFG